MTGCIYIHPYRPLFSQGNIITQEQLDQIRPGMSSEQVRVIMGTPVLVNTFSNSSWDYVYTLQKGKVFKDYKRMVVYFQNDRVVNIDSYFPPKPPRYRY